MVNPVKHIPCGHVYDKVEYLRICIIVKTNSKYKEDDFSDSNADVNSLNVCVHRKQAHHMCQIPAHLSSRFTRQSAENTHEIHNSVSTLAPL